MEKGKTLFLGACAIIFAFLSFGAIVANYVPTPNIVGLFNTFWYLSLFLLLVGVLVATFCSKIARNIFVISVIAFIIGAAIGENPPIAALNAITKAVDHVVKNYWTFLPLVLAAGIAIFLAYNYKLNRKRLQNK